MKVVIVSVLISIVVGMLVAGTVVVVSEPRERAGRLLVSLRGIVDLVTIAGIASLGLSVPIGLVGGALALRLVRRERVGVSTLMWIFRGAGWGAVLGFCGSAIAAGLRSVVWKRSFGPSYLLLLLTYAGGAGTLPGCS